MQKKKNPVKVLQRQFINAPSNFVAVHRLHAYNPTKSIIKTLEALKIINIFLVNKHWANNVSPNKPPCH